MGYNHRLLGASVSYTDILSRINQKRRWENSKYSTQNNQNTITGKWHGFNFKNLTYRNFKAIFFKRLDPFKMLPLNSIRIQK